MRPTGSHPSSSQGPRPGRGSPSDWPVTSRPPRPSRAILLPAALLALVLALGVPTLAVDGATSTGDASFPVTLIDDEGTAVEIPTAPGRIISLTPGTTEILFAIGVGDRVVATTDADDHPPEAVALPDVGSFGSIDIERIVDLGPDLVIAGGNGYTPAEDIGRLRSLGYPVLVIYAPSVGAVIEDVGLIGAAVGRRAAAADVAEAMRDGFASLEGIVRDLPRPRVFYEIDASVQIYGPADESFLAEMVDVAGGEPITSGSAMSFEVSLERLIESDPEIIVLGDAAYGTTPEMVAARPGWEGMTAVREGAIRPVADVLVTRPGPRLVEGLRDLIEAIHPGAVR